MNILTADFYYREVTLVARDLLGKRLVRCIKGKRLSGFILETEAYRGEEDLACHARSGRTPRNAFMYGPAGHAYVYFTYGMHWCLNAVTGAEGFPAAVLIRSVWPVEGLQEIALRRGTFPRAQWCNGPAKLCQALAIDKEMNGTALFDGRDGLWVEEGIAIADSLVSTGPRVGIDSVPEPWRSQPWRYQAKLPDEYENG